MTAEVELSKLGLYCTSHMRYMPEGTVIVDGGQNGSLCQACADGYAKMVKKPDEKKAVSKAHPMDKVRKRQEKLSGRVRKKP